MARPSRWPASTMTRGRPSSRPPTTCRPAVSRSPLRSRSYGQPTVSTPRRRMPRPTACAGSSSPASSTRA
eukprot:1928831-Alexandrium_andersonii.AAC.1